MSNHIAITNNCKSAHFHCAISWDSIQQHYFNDVGPGKTADFPLNDIGWHDLTIVPATKDNGFKSGDNNKLNIGKMFLQAIPFAALAGPFGVMIAGVGTIVSVSLDQSGAFPVYTLEIPGGGTKKVSVAKGVSLDCYPILITGLYTPHGNYIEVTGGDVQFRTEPDGNYTITAIDPLRAHWHNHTNNSTQNYVAEKP